MNSTGLKDRHDIHLARKIWHFSGISLVTYVYLILPQIKFIQLAILFTVFSLCVDFMRLKLPKMNQIVLKILGPIMRKNEAQSTSGVTYMAIGVLITVVVFYKWPKLVVLALLFLATADPIASYFGIRFGRDRLFGRKSLQGTMAAFIVCILVSFAYFVTYNIMTERLMVVCVLSGLAGAISEAVPVGKLDDNLVLPVLSASLLWVIFFLFGGL